MIDYQLTGTLDSVLDMFKIYNVVLPHLSVALSCLLEFDTEVFRICSVVSP